MDLRRWLAAAGDPGYATNYQDEPRLLPIRTQQEQAIVLNDSDSNAVKPTKPAQEISGKARVLGEEHRSLELDTKGVNRDLMLVGHKESCHGSKPLNPAGFDIQSEFLAIPAFEDAVGCSSIELGDQFDLLVADR
jgi:hypothetical protein